MGELVNGRLPRVTPEGTAKMVARLQREMMDVQAVLNPAYIKEIEPAFESLRRRVDDVERRLNGMDQELGRFMRGQHDLDARVARLEARANPRGRFAALRARLRRG